MNETCPLSSLAPGARAVVTEIRVPVQHRARLLEMGLLVGTPVELIRYNLSLRRHEAEQVMVKLQG
jgi:Fe2+ transport system protein FeoA